MNLLRTVCSVSSMTLLSRIFGFLRDALIARVFGVTDATDAFWIAFKIPNLLRRTFAEGAFSQAFVPLFAQYRKTKSAEETRALLDHTAGWLIFALVCVTTLGILAAPGILTLSATGFSHSPEKFALTMTLLRWLFPYIFLISLASFAGSILNAHQSYWLPAFTPVLLNVSMIGATLLLAPHLAQPIFALAIGVLAGGVLQLGVQLPALHKRRQLPRPRFQWHNPDARRLMRHLGPALFGVSISQISLLINSWFASFLQKGSVTWLYYADRLMELPTGLLGAALGTVLLPALARQCAAKNHAASSALLDWGLRLTLCTAAPAAVGLALLAEPLLATLFLGGKYTAFDVRMTAQALQAYSVGLLGLIAVKVLAPGFYAHQDLKAPVKIGIAVLGITQILNIFFVQWMQHAGLALAISVGGVLNAALLYYFLRRLNYFQPGIGWMKFGIQVAIATLTMGAVVLWLRGAQTMWVSADTTALSRVLRLSGCIGAGAVAYCGTLMITGVRLSNFRLLHKD